MQKLLFLYYMDMDMYFKKCYHERIEEREFLGKKKMKKIMISWKKKSKIRKEKKMVKIN